MAFLHRVRIHNTFLQVVQDDAPTRKSRSEGAQQRCKGDAFEPLARKLDNKLGLIWRERQETETSVTDADVFQHRVIFNGLEAAMETHDVEPSVCPTPGSSFCGDLGYQSEVWPQPVFYVPLVWAFASECWCQASFGEPAGAALGNVGQAAPEASIHAQGVTTDDSYEFLPQRAFDLLPEAILVSEERQPSDWQGQLGPTTEQNDFPELVTAIHELHKQHGDPTADRSVSKAGSYLSALLKNIGDPCSPKPCVAASFACYCRELRF